MVVKSANMGGGFQLDWKINVGALMSVVIQSAAIVWWASGVENRLSVVEKYNSTLATKDYETRLKLVETWTAQNSQVSDRLGKLEERLGALKETNTRIENKLDNLFIAKEKK